MRQMLQPGPEHSNTTVPAMLYSPTPPSLREHNLGGKYKRKEREDEVRLDLQQIVVYQFARKVHQSKKVK